MKFIQKYLRKYIQKDIYISPEERLTIIGNLEIKLLNNTPNQPSKFRAKYWAQVNAEFHGTYNVNSQIKFRTSRLRSSLCDYSDANILVRATITVLNTGTAAKPNSIKNMVIKNCVLFTNYINEVKQYSNR